MTYLTIIKKILGRIFGGTWKFIKDNIVPILFVAGACFAWHLYSVNTELKSQIEDVNKLYKEQLETNKKLIAWDKEKTEILDEHRETNDKLSEQEQVIVERIDSLTRKAEAEIAAAEKNSSNSAEQVTKIKETHSTNVISTTWEHYCRNNKNAKGC